MRAKERYEEIERIVNDEGNVTFSMLKERFPDISDMTLRRDLEYLDRQKRIIRIYGGARSVLFSAGMEDNYYKRNMLNQESKALIARKALSLIRPNTSIFMDSGTTTTKLCEVIPSEEHFLIFTTGLTCALELKKQPNVSIYLFGGKMNTASLSTYGSPTVESIRRVHFNIAFIGSTGFDLNFGFTCENEEDAKIKTEAIDRADFSVVLLDSSKVGKTYTYTFARPEKIQYVVTDDKCSPEVCSALQAVGVHVI